jgi:hypothetical protein
MLTISCCYARNAMSAWVYINKSILFNCSNFCRHQKKEVLFIRWLKYHYFDFTLCRQLQTSFSYCKPTLWSCQLLKCCRWDLLLLPLLQHSANIDAIRAAGIISELMKSKKFVRQKTSSSPGFYYDEEGAEELCSHLPTAMVGNLITVTTCLAKPLMCSVMASHHSRRIARRLTLL